jgi:hypothetical protein
MEEHAGAALLEGVKGTDHDRDLTVRGLAAHQPYDGILAFKMVTQRDPPPFSPFLASSVRSPARRKAAHSMIKNASVLSTKLLIHSCFDSVDWPPLFSTLFSNC